MDDLTLQNPSVAATQMYEELTSPQIDWTLVTILLIVVTIIGAVLARARTIRARRRRGEVAQPVTQSSPSAASASGEDVASATSSSTH